MRDGPPLVSVITPTWQRHELLLTRCVPSVAAQRAWPPFEHVIVSDGPDPVLAARTWPRYARYTELGEHSGACWGHLARMAGIAAARGQILAWLDDDDAWRPDHLAACAGALLDNPAAGFAVPRMIAHLPCGDVRIGDGPLARGRVATSVIVHWRDILDAATWEAVPCAPDWDLVRRWLDAGIGYASVDAVTVDYYPSAPLEGVPVSYRPHRAVTA